MRNRPTLHIAVVSTQEKWHGGEKQAALLAQGLKRHGHRCTLICREDGEFARRMEREFEVHRLPKNIRSPFTMFRLRRLLADLKPDILHTNDAHALTASGIASLGLSIPIRAVARRVDFPLRSPHKYRTLADGLICVSTAVADVCQSSGVPAAQLHVVPDGVEPRFAESGLRSRGRRSLKVTKDQKLLLTVAKLTDHKGHRYLVEALPKLVAAHPNLVVAFAGDGELREKLEKHVCRLDLQPFVRFLGYRNDVNDLLTAADVVVQPSHMEGLCSSLIDAMFAARPIVATQAGGIPDLLQVGPGEQQVAWLVPPRKPHELSQAIHFALQDDQAAERRGQAARERALRMFTADQMVDRTLQAYEAIAKQRYGVHAAFAGLFSPSRPTRSAA